MASATDERLNEAQRRAAVLGSARGAVIAGIGIEEACEYIAGWAEAIQALRQFFDGGNHMTSCNLSVLVGEDCTDVTCSPFCREVRNATTTFIRAMLGEAENKQLHCPLTSKPLMKGTLKEHNEGKHKAYQFASCTLCNPLLRMP